MHLLFIRIIISTKWLSKYNEVLFIFFEMVYFKFLKEKMLQFHCFGISGKFFCLQNSDTFLIYTDIWLYLFYFFLFPEWMKSLLYGYLLSKYKIILHVWIGYSCKNKHPWSRFEVWSSHLHVEGWVMLEFE